MILFWAASLSVKHLELCWAPTLALCTGTDLQDHRCSAAGAGWPPSAVCYSGHSQALLRENPNSPRFFLKNSTLEDSLPFKGFLNLISFFSLIPSFIPGSMRFSFSHIFPEVQRDALDGYPKFCICSVLLCVLQDICWVFLLKIQQCRSGSRMQLQCVSLVQTWTGINSCTDAADQNRRI